MSNKKIKKALGPIIHLDCADVDAVGAHRLLGQDASAQIHKILAQRLDNMDDVAEQIRRARSYQRALIEKLQHSLPDESVRAAIKSYLACVSAWAQGAQLADFRHAQLAELDATPDDLAFLLQEDEVGCQTGVYRERDGSVILWHSEEDYEQTPGQRFDKLRLFSFRTARGDAVTAFIYPDLLPGPTFGWQNDDFIQAIDSLHVKFLNLGAATLPNTLAWLSLYLGTRVPKAELVRALLPFQGGYSLTALSKAEGVLCVEKVEFANDQFATSALEQPAGCYLFQTNVIANLDSPIGAQEQTSAESRQWNEKRLARTARFMRSVQKKSTGALSFIARLLRSQRGGGAAYSNRDVKAYLLCQMSAAKTSIQVGAGPAMLGDVCFAVER